MDYITGDIHGSTEPLQDLMTRFQPIKDDIVVLLGDVGINYTGEVRDRLMKQEISRMKPTFFCIHGNHENRPQNISSYQEKEWHGGRVLYEPDFPKIMFPVDDDIFDIEGKQCIVIGGAYSVDKHFRLKMGYKWWEDEQPSHTIKEYVEKQVKTHQIDVVFSHTCPFKYIPIECLLPGIDHSTVDNSTKHWLDTIETMTDYKAWYQGHWHINKRFDKIHFLMHDVEMMGD